MTTASTQQAFGIRRGWPIEAAKRGKVCWLTAAVGLVVAGWSRAAWAGETVGRRTWWLPENIFPPGDAIDHLFYFLLYLTGGICIAVFVALAAFLIKYRYEPGRHPKFIHGNTRLEMVWTLVPTVILALIAAFSQATWSTVKYHPPIGEGEEVVRMEVIGKQFQWYFHYPGADGKLGPRRQELIDKTSSDPDVLIGLDRDHPDGRDDILAPKMYIPVNTRVLIDLNSVDVIHSFFLPNFRIKQDALPGLTGQVWLEATKTSRQVIGMEADGSPKPFDIVCAELCGQGHYKMRGQLFVVSQEEYEAFLEEEASYLDLGGDDEDYY